MLLLLSADFFKNLFRSLSERYILWIQIRTEVLLVIIWVKTVCKGYHQTTKVVTSKGRVIFYYFHFQCVSLYEPHGESCIHFSSYPKTTFCHKQIFCLHITSAAIIQMQRLGADNKDTTNEERVN